MIYQSVQDGSVKLTLGAEWKADPKTGSGTTVSERTPSDTISLTPITGGVSAADVQLTDVFIHPPAYVCDTTLIMKSTSVNRQTVSVSGTLSVLRSPSRLQGPKIASSIFIRLQHGCRGSGQGYGNAIKSLIVAVLIYRRIRYGRGSLLCMSGDGGKTEISTGSTENRQVQLYWFHGTSDVLSKHTLSSAHELVSVLIPRMMIF
ncbi:uncharacterized protein ARMOST_18842 [Armillaria ostoyae]|uniref:Uncharacterized protein n=1 Tax=Armillaria ostoyae TaxID=47428 RepID=A0A284S2Y3_ARMOS|nr:uncharacterized protein ARMOST_18842 [Armillaria ostoyae]